MTLLEEFVRNYPLFNLHLRMMAFALCQKRVSDDPFQVSAHIENCKDCQKLMKEKFHEQWEDEYRKNFRDENVILTDVGFIISGNMLIIPGLGIFAVKEKK